MEDSSKINWYVSSSGAIQDIKNVETTHLINALAKHHREIYNSTTKSEMIKHSEQITLIEKELLNRNEIFNKEKFGGENE